MPADLDLSPEAVERLEKMADTAEKAAVNAERMCELLRTEFDAFKARTGHNTYVVRDYLDHRDAAERQRKEASAIRALAAENTRLRAERDEQRERAEEAESEITRAQEQVSAEFEGDCWKAMRNLLESTGFDWSEYSEDGVSASEAQRWIVEELDRLEAERDAAWQAGAEAMQKVAARTAVATPATRSDKAGVVWHDGFTSGCLHAADAIRALPLPGQPKDDA